MFDIDDDIKLLPSPTAAYLESLVLKEALLATERSSLEGVDDGEDDRPDGVRRLVADGDVGICDIEPAGATVVDDGWV